MIGKDILTWSNSTIYIFLFHFYHLLWKVLWSVLQCSRSWSPQFLLLKTSALQSYVREPVRVPWIPDQWLDRESVRLDVRRSKNMWSLWINSLSIYVLKHRQIWYERRSTQKDLSFLLIYMYNTWVDLLLAFKSSMICMRNIWTVLGIWPSLRSERKWSKRVRFESD